MDIRQRFSRWSVDFSSLSAPAFFWQPLQSLWSSLAANHMFGELNEDICLLNFPPAFIDHVDDDFSKGHQSIVHKKRRRDNVECWGGEVKRNAVRWLVRFWREQTQASYWAGHVWYERGICDVRDVSQAEGVRSWLPSSRFVMAREDVSFLKWLSRESGREYKHDWPRAREHISMAFILF